MNYVIVKRIADGIEISDIYIQGKNIEKLNKEDTVFEFSENLGKNDLDFAIKYLMQGNTTDDNNFIFAGKCLTIISVVKEMPENQHRQSVRNALKSLTSIPENHGLVVGIVGNSEKLRLYEVTEIMDEIKKAVKKNTPIEFANIFEDVKNISVIIACETNML